KDEAGEAVETFQELRVLDEGIERARNRILYFPDDVEGYLALAGLQRRQGRPEEALSTLEQASLIGPPEPVVSVRYFLGKLPKTLGRDMPLTEAMSR
ncbi:MAG: hypothetical protein ACE5JI_21490, partial [Acidobacteriota bacterium]